MGDHVKIRLGLFNQTIDLLESFDPKEFDPLLACCHKYVLLSLLEKRDRLNLRKSYSKMVYANDEEERFDARMKYLYEKHNCNG